MKILRLLTHHGLHNTGEVAGYPDAEADALIASKKAVLDTPEEVAAGEGDEVDVEETSLETEGAEKPRAPRATRKPKK